MKQKIISTTTMFICILLFITFFQNIFGASTKIVGITVLIIGLGISEKDLTQNLGLLVIKLICFLLVMGISSYLSVLNPYLGLFINFNFIFYATYINVERNKKPYHFPFILGYLFLIFLSPSTPEALPSRLIALIGGAFCIVGVQLYFNRNTYDKMLNSRLDKVCNQLIHRLERILARDVSEHEEEVDILKASMGRFMKVIYDRFSSNGQLTKGGVGRITQMVTYEKMYYLLDDVAKDYEAGLISEETIEELLTFVKNQKQGNPSELNLEMFEQGATSIRPFKQIITVLKAIQDDKYPIEKRGILRLLKPIDVESYAFKFAIRLAILLSGSLFVLQLFDLSYGRWLCFTLAALVQPDIETSEQKTVQRLIGTGLGVVVFSVLMMIFKEDSQRALIVLVCSYIGMYINRYDLKVSFVTVQALGGAIVTAPGTVIVGNRIVYIVLGALIAYLGNKWLFPIRRKEIKEHYVGLYEQQKQQLITHPSVHPQEVIINAYHFLEMGELEDTKYFDWLDVSFEALVQVK